MGSDLSFHSLFSRFFFSFPAFPYLFPYNCISIVSSSHSLFSRFISFPVFPSFVSLFLNISTSPDLPFHSLFSRFSSFLASHSFTHFFTSPRPLIHPPNLYSFVSLAFLYLLLRIHFFTFLFFTFIFHSCLSPPPPADAYLLIHSFIASLTILPLHSFLTSPSLSCRFPYISFF